MKKKSKWSAFKSTFLWPIWYYVLIISIVWLISNQILKWTFILVRTSVCTQAHLIEGKTGNTFTPGDPRPLYVCEY